MNTETVSRHRIWHSHLLFTFNIYRIALVCNASSKQEQTTATQRQEKAMDKLHGKDRKIKELEMKYEKLLKEKAEQEKETSTNNKSNTSNNESQKH